MYCDEDFEVERHDYFNDFDFRYDDATSIVDDVQVNRHKEDGTLKGFKKIGKDETDYDPRTCISIRPYEYEMNDYSWNSDCHYCLLEDGKIKDKKLAERILDLTTKKCIKANSRIDELVEYKVI
jgi:hypothetical protein